MCSLVWGPYCSAHLRTQCREQESLEPHPPIPAVQEGSNPWLSHRSKLLCSHTHPVPARLISTCHPTKKGCECFCFFFFFHHVFPLNVSWMKTHLWTNPLSQHTLQPLFTSRYTPFAFQNLFLMRWVYSLQELNYYSTVTSPAQYLNAKSIKCWNKDYLRKCSRKHWRLLITDLYRFCST